jgi:cytidyltransferase-like protein
MKIGFTVGVWDLFHEGHQKFLEKAKDHCDYLCVGIMTDFWVRVQKGHDRPFESLELRTTRLRETKLADKIVILDTLDVHPYLQIADVWIKSEGQKNMRPTIWPNEVFIPRTPDISTTEIAKKFRNFSEEEI